MLIVRTHQYFPDEAQQRLDPLGRAVRERVATCLAVSESTVARVVAHWNTHGDEAFTLTPAKRGCPPRSVVETYHEYITDIVKKRNLAKKPATSRAICSDIKNLTGMAIPERTMRDELARMNMSYVRGRKRDPRADSEANVAFRYEYLTKKVSNLSRRLYPKLTEVYLDESYCNVNHVAGATWLLKNSPRYISSGARQRYCIVGAGAVMRKNGGLHAEWVQGSIRTWPLHLKDDGTSDYHDNFTGEIFETWFEELSGLLQRRYGPCRIHMDGASYHKVIEDPAPSSSKSKAVMVQWLHGRGITVTITDYTKKQLELIIAQARPPTTYRAVTTARKFGHEVLYTPPYHPELQPIEMIWGALKNRIAMDPASSVADLGEKITAGLEAISSREWLGAYKKVRKQEVAYLDQSPPPQMTPAPSIQELQHLASASDLEGASNVTSSETTSDEYHISF